MTRPEKLQAALDGAIVCAEHAAIQRVDKDGAPRLDKEHMVSGWYAYRAADLADRWIGEEWRTIEWARAAAARAKARDALLRAVDSATADQIARASSAMGDGGIPTAEDAIVGAYMDAVRPAIAEARQEAEAARAELAAARKECAECQQALADAQRARGEAQAARDRARAEAQALKDSLETVRGDLSRALGDLARLQGERARVDEDAELGRAAAVLMRRFGEVWRGA